MEDEEVVPIEYLRNENPFAFCKDYHKNMMCLEDKKTKLAALEKIQPGKINFRMSQRFLEKERYSLIEAAAANRRNALIPRGLAILGVEYTETPEEVLEQNIHLEEILDIVLELKKYRLVHLQRKLRTKVSFALSKKLENDKECVEFVKKPLEIDNLKDALVYTNLEMLYENRNEDAPE